MDGAGVLPVTGHGLARDDDHEDDLDDDLDDDFDDETSGDGADDLTDDDAWPDDEDDEDDEDEDDGPAAWSWRPATADLRGLGDDPARSPDDPARSPDDPARSPDDPGGHRQAWAQLISGTPVSAGAVPDPTPAAGMDLLGRLLGHPRTAPEPPATAAPAPDVQLDQLLGTGTGTGTGTDRRPSDDPTAVLLPVQADPAGTPLIGAPRGPADELPPPAPTPSSPSASPPASPPAPPPGRPPVPGSGAGGPSVLDSRWAQDSAVTRMLCATAHLHGEYAEEAAGALTDPSFTAIAPTWGLDPVALAQHAKLACDRRKERDRSLRFLLAGMVIIPAVIVALALVGGLPPFGVALGILLVTVGGFVAAWMIVFAHYELIRISALEAMDGRLSPRDTAPTLDADTRQRLEELAEGNVVVFGGYQPFVGCGVTLDSWTLCVDLAPAGPDPIAPFDPWDLQQHLLRTVPAQTPGGLWAAPRLFVAGTAAKGVPGLVPDPRETATWPAARLPQEVLERFTRQPSQTARTYTCLAQPAWEGEIVVSMLTRAELAGGKLFVEGRMHALLPPKAVFREYKFVPKHPRRAWLAVARSAADVVVPLLLGSYQRHLDLAKAGRTFRRNRERLRKDLIEGHPYNYGASTTLREDVADASELKYYAAVDEVRSFRILKRQILDAVGGFLAEHGADTAEFVRQAELSLGETTVHLHDLAAAADAFGPRNTVTVGQ